MQAGCTLARGLAGRKARRRVGVAAAGAAAALPTTQAGGAASQNVHCPRASQPRAHKRPPHSLRSTAEKAGRACHLPAALLLLGTVGSCCLLLARAAVAGVQTAAQTRADILREATGCAGGLLLAPICPILCVTLNWPWCGETSQVRMGGARDAGPPRLFL